MLLPLLKDSITSNATVAHTMKIVMQLLYHINPGQIAVITADQPVYAIGKQVQWLYPTVYGEDSLVMMMVVYTSRCAFWQRLAIG
jgi:hypothetical protein